MAEVFSGILKVPVAASPTALSFEVSSSLTVDGNSVTAVNKATSGFSSQQPTTRTWSIDFEANLDDTSNPALDVIKNAALAGTLLENCEFETAVTGWTFTGDTYVTSFGIQSGASDYLTVSGTLGGNGAVVAS